MFHFDKKLYSSNIYLYDLIHILDKLIKINCNYIYNIIYNLYSNKIKVIYYNTNDNINYKVNFDRLCNLLTYSFTPYEIAIKNMI